MEKPTGKLTKDLINLFSKKTYSPIVRGSSISKRVSSDYDNNRIQSNNKTPIEINEQYSKALSIIKSNSSVVFITGKAGTGKSTFIRFLRDNFDPDIPVLAPTGVAAINVHGQTIHSFFQFPPNTINTEDIKTLRNHQMFGTLKSLIIDEVSMVRADLMDAIDLSLKRNTGRMALPFGGIQLILVGDLLQLPPVISSDAEMKYLFNKYRTPYFLSADCLQSSPLQIIELNKVYRQQDDKFISLLSNIRIGESIESSIKEINRHCYIGKKCDKSVITLTADNAAADQINNSKLINLNSEQHEYIGTVKGRFNIEENRLPAPKLLKLKVGAHVMFTKNDQDHRWVNGTTGVVSGLADFVITVETKNGRFDVTYETWETIKYKYDENTGKIKAEIIGTYTQFPLMLSWAITIHKSQGKTLDHILIDLGNGAFADGQVYVALSRCRSFDGISLKRPLRESDVKVDPIVKEFYSGLLKL